MRRDPLSRRGVTLTELLVVVAIVGMLLMLLLPAVQAVREVARRTECFNRQKQVASAALKYADEHREYLPVGCHNSEWTTWAIALLPQLEHQALYDQYDDRPYLAETRFNVGSNAVVSATPIPLFTCPSDGWTRVRMTGKPIAHNVVACTGNGLYEATAAGWFTLPPRGVDWVRFVGATTVVTPDGEVTEYWSRQPTVAGFKGGCYIMSGGDENLSPAEQAGLQRPAQAVRLPEVTDGLSKTIAFSEVIRQPSGGTDGTGDRRGLTTWGPGSLFTTQRRPNTSDPDVMPWAGDCGETTDAAQVDPPCYAPHYEGEPYAVAARSRHEGGVVVAFVDSHVEFKSDSIGSVVWANLGTTREEVTTRTEGWSPF